mgnify:CR=1 FL=1
MRSKPSIHKGEDSRKGKGFGIGAILVVEHQKLHIQPIGKSLYIYTLIVPQFIACDHRYIAIVQTLLTPFMSCSAKIPIYGFFTNAFFPGKGGLILAGLYLLSILVGVLVALITKLFRKNYVAAPFVMELPNYRMPGLKNVSHLLWDKTKDFVQRAFTVIFVATIVIWLLQTFDFRFNMPNEIIMIYYVILRKKLIFFYAIAQK